MRIGYGVAVCLIAASFWSTAAVGAENGDAIPAEVRSYPIQNFKIGSSQRKFGRLEYVGGFEMRSKLDQFGAMSGFRFLTPGERFVGVTDSGYWFYGSVDRDAEANPTGFSDFTMQPMIDADGSAGASKWNSDAEGLAVNGDRVTVGFEREHRIAEFDVRPGDMGAEIRQLDFVVPAHELRRNKGFETVAYTPAASSLSGARIAITERSIDTQGNIFAAILEGPEKGVFKVVRRGTFDITAGAFLANGDLLLLERSFDIANGVQIRFRQIDTATIKRGSTVDGEVIFEADLRYQIDNMEGLDTWLDADGRQRVSIVSDDNLSFLQRNLYLEFILSE